MCIDCGNCPDCPDAPEPSLTVLGGHDLTREAISGIFDALPALRDALLSRKDAEEAGGIFAAAVPGKSPCPCEEGGDCSDAADPDTQAALHVAEGEGMPPPTF